MSEPFNLNRRAAEVVRAPFQFIWGPSDERWTLKNAFKLDASLVAKAMSGDFNVIQEALRAGLGDEQWGRFSALEFDLDAMRLLFNAWTDHAGLDAGESSGSTDSSTGSTAEPSKQTSTATTASESTAPSTEPPMSGTAPVNS